MLSCLFLATTQIRNQFSFNRKLELSHYSVDSSCQAFSSVITQDNEEVGRVIVEGIPEISVQFAGLGEPTNILLTALRDDELQYSPHGCVHIVGGFYKEGFLKAGQSCVLGTSAQVHVKKGTKDFVVKFHMNIWQPYHYNILTEVANSIAFIKVKSAKLRSAVEPVSGTSLNTTAKLIPWTRSDLIIPLIIFSTVAGGVAFMLL